MKKFLFLFLFLWINMQANIDIKIESEVLKNGLKVYYSQNKTTPTVAVAVYYNVGSRNEEQGKTGFAHLFEHMMFQGSKNVDKGEYFKYIENNGGEMNGTTSKEKTNFYQTMPSNQLELALWLESDRMGSLMVNSLNFENQRSVVKEEKSSSYDNRPYGMLFLELDNLAYDNEQYKHSVIGSIEDLDKATTTDALDFYKRYYTPDNAVLVIVGDFELETAKGFVNKYFDKIKKGELARKKFDFTDKPQTKKRTKKTVDKLAKMPAIAIAYKSPAALQKDYYSLAMLEEILFNSNSSRLYQKLVKDTELSLNIFGGANFQAGPNLFYIYSIVKKGKIEEVKKIIYAEIENIKANGITEDELKKAKNKINTDFIFQLQSNLKKALLIGNYALFFNDPSLITKEYEYYEKVTKEDVQNAVKTYFKEEFINEIEITIQ